MDKRKKMIVVVTGLVVLCICAAGCTTTETAGGETPAAVEGTLSAVHTPDEEMPEDKPDMGMMENGTVPDGTPPEGAPGDAPEMDSDHALEMLLMLEESGIDTTEAEAALNNGDMDTVLAFIQENMPAGGDGGGGPGGAGPGDQQAPPPTE